METQTIDRLFLELSQVTHATTAKENALQDEVKRLREALVYVAFAGHATPLHMLPKGVTLIDDDTVEVRLNAGRVARATLRSNAEVRGDAPP
jgi:hypothetical protein